MATITLWHINRSPPSWAARMMADILGVNVELKEIDFLNLEHKSPAFRKMNPMGTIPVIKDGDLYIAESHTIIKYLLNKYGKEEHKKLYPSDRVQQAMVDQINFFDSGVAFTKAITIALSSLFEGWVGVSPKIIKETEDVYEIIETYLDGKDYVASNEFTVADISLGSTAFALNGFVPLDQVKYPRTAAWLDRLRSKSFVQNIALPGAHDLITFYKALWEKNKANK